MTVTGVVALVFCFIQVCSHYPYLSCGTIHAQAAERCSSHEDDTITGLRVQGSRSCCPRTRCLTDRRIGLGIWHTTLCCVPFYAMSGGPGCCLRATASALVQWAGALSVPLGTLGGPEYCQRTAACAPFATLLSGQHKAHAQKNAPLSRRRSGSGQRTGSASKKIQRRIQRPSCSDSHVFWWWPAFSVCAEYTRIDGTVES